MLMKTKMTNATMLVQKEKNTGSSYVTPESLGNKVGLDTRAKKEADKDIRAGIEKQVRIDNPGATEEGINAIVYRIMYEKNLAESIPDDKELTLKPDMKRTLAKRIEIKRHHDGVFEVTKWDPKKKERWSCCQCKDKDGPGCIVQKIDKDKWVLSS